MQFTYPFADLGTDFSSPIELSPLDEARLASWNHDAGNLINTTQPPENIVPLLNGELELEKPPVSSLYAGHQFGAWVSQLGDGRAAILGQIDTDKGSWELQLKGSGPTPYSRGADGRAVLRSSIREYLCSEAMHGLKIATTRALCLLDSSTPVYREEVETGALIVRMAPTHIRFGSFEVFASRNQSDQVQQLADYVIDNFYPECRKKEKTYVAFYHSVISKTAEMIAGWMAQGFAHGVMNSDNMSILGLTIDYGPFGFMEGYNPGFICNHSDHHGRYVFNQQPNIALWNLGCLGNALLSLIEIEDAQKALDSFADQYLKHYHHLMLKKLGIEKIADESDKDKELLGDLLRLMQNCHADYSRTFRLLSRAETHKEAAALFGTSKEFKNWLGRFSERTSGLKGHERLALGNNPKYVLRNYMAQITIDKAKAGNYSEIERLLKVLQSPFDEHLDAEEYFREPPTWAQSLSVSCSS